MIRHEIPKQLHRWGVIMAGGEGVRLRSLTRLITGDDRPKQFCSLAGGRSLLAQTRQRIAPYISQDRTLFLLLESHEPFYSNELGSVAPRQLVVQPRSRGTLAAILCSLTRILRRDPHAVVALFPSDHHYLDERNFMAGVELAFAGAEADPANVILLGAPAKHAETGYGWIEAEPAVSTRTCEGLLKVRRFWEKPSAHVAQGLLDRGCVWNTFVMVGRVQALWEMIRSCAAEQVRVFEPLLALDANEPDADALERIYDKIPMADFSSQVLSTAVSQLRVLCLGDVGWSDMGDPQRVIDVLSETGITQEWVTHWQAGVAAAASA